MVEFYRLLLIMVQVHTKPQIQISSPSYSNLAVTGVSRRGIGNTTDTGTGALISVNVGSSNTSVGIGSTLFTIKEFVLENPGYNFKLGDVFKPVGLVTAAGVTTMTDFELTVLDVFTDQYSSWNFGQFDFIDSIKDLQDGSRTRFPLIYNANLLSFEKEENSLLDLKSLLLIFINGVVQDLVKHIHLMEEHHLNLHKHQIHQMLLIYFSIKEQRV